MVLKLLLGVMHGPKILSDLHCYVLETLVICYCRETYICPSKLSNPHTLTDTQVTPTMAWPPNVHE